MLGAIIGDICGSVYEFNNEKDIAKIELFKEGCFPTDDSVMTAAVGRALMDTYGQSERGIRGALVDCMQYYGHLFPRAGYGGRFGSWLYNRSRKPYGSFGNGAGMRVSAAGWMYDTLEETVRAAELTSAVTHDHPEGIKGAVSIAAAIFLARTGHSKEEIKAFTEANFYKLDFTLDEIRPSYGFDETCQGSCPPAIQAFLESEDFEDAIKKSISIGGDSDTLAAMTGAIAEAFYGIKKDTAEKAFEVLKDRRAFSRGQKLLFNNSVLAFDLVRFRGWLEANGKQLPKLI